MAVTQEDSFRVPQRWPLVEQVSHRLRELILTHEIPAGSKLVQADLADRMGVSRTPLREAMRLLEQDGLVRVSNGNRTVEVVSFTGVELTELYEIREVVDGLAARLLARRGMSHDADQQIASTLEAMAANIQPLNGESYLSAHLGFHVGIIEHCGNDRLKGQLSLVRVTAASLRDAFPRELKVRPTANTAQADHQAIYDAIRSGNETAAEKAARHHIRRSMRLIPDA
jgi:GntR family transcriptional regulator of vanillate catabolism